ncbi:hypothetical protein Tco_1124527 [Tanacetum coccineum]|uniref:Uncharacterized protein n=1 Tax=Tanacetum coccineum TaxID=301880 RepID=A0ABQ5J6D7_9ASTR
MSIFLRDKPQCTGVVQRGHVILICRPEEADSTDGLPLKLKAGSADSFNQGRNVAVKLQQYVFVQFSGNSKDFSSQCLSEDLQVSQRAKPKLGCMVSLGESHPFDFRLALLIVTLWFWFLHSDTIKYHSGGVPRKSQGPFDNGMEVQKEEKRIKEMKVDLKPWISRMYDACVLERLILLIGTAGENKGQREVKAPIQSEEKCSIEVKGKILSREDQHLLEAIYMFVREEMTEQATEDKREAQENLRSSITQNEDWDLIRAKTWSNA